MPGVHAVFTYHDLPAALCEQPVPLLVPGAAIRHVALPYALVKEEVSLAGESVAVVLAEDR